MARGKNMAPVPSVARTGGNSAGQPSTAAKLFKGGWHVPAQGAGGNSISTDPKEYLAENQFSRKAMGTNAYAATSRGPSAGIMQPRDKGRAAGMIESATTAHRAPITESALPRQRVTIKRFDAQADPQLSGQTFRNVRTLPSTMGNKDSFWSGRNNSYA